MKKIFIIISVFFLLFISSCEEKKIKVVLNENIELQNFMTYENEYELTKNELFTLPQIENNTYVLHETNDFEDYVLYNKTIYTIEFYGWEDENNKLLSSSSVKLSKDTVLSPKYNISTKNYSIKLVTNGVSFTTLNDSDIYNFILPTIENVNYTFGGWYYNELFIGKPIESIAYTNVEEETILYAKLIPTLDYVNNLISSLPEKLTIFDIKSIELAYDCYNRLSYQDKQKVTNYSKLQLAYEQIENLKQAYDIYCQLIELYEKDLTADLKTELDMLVNLLDTLEEELKTLIPNLDYEKITDIVDKVNVLYDLYAQEAIEFDKKIAAIPIFMEHYYEEEILNLYNEYQNLDHNLIVLLNAEEKLETLYQNLQNTLSKDTILYINTPNTNNVYMSKKQLFEAFFTDFYYYIAAYHGLSYLKENKLNNVEEFVTLAGDFTGAGANNLYGIGNIAGRYMLERDVNGILENQTDNGFFGFCYQNNLYQDVLPFFINFFAYWRIDEGYANKSNYGADIFAESWAPTVDIAKFFYYDENTSYVKSERMMDCLLNTASVLYEESSSNNLPIYKLRGYKFDGWYNNKEFTGEKITSLNDSNTKKLYAKWLIDQDQIDKDSANLVDVYIYNLTTSKAVVNNVTVGYVKTMYDNLSKKGKSLVENYSTLKKLMDQYI